MSNYTAATVEGHVTHEPIIRTTKTGKNVCLFSIAINHYSSPDTPPKVSFIDIETWEKLADMCAKNISKGKHVMIIGTLKQDRWEGKDGRPVKNQACRKPGAVSRPGTGINRAKKKGWRGTGSRLMHDAAHTACNTAYQSGRR